MLESVQKFACKVCLKCWDMDYDNMLHCFDLPLLRVRHQHLKLITMFNIINGNIVFPAGIFNLHQHLSQRNNSSVFHRLHSRTNYFYFSYVPSVITVWNTLPVDIRSSSSVSVFKHNLLHWAHVLYWLTAIYMLPPISLYCTSYLTCIEKRNPWKWILWRTCGGILCIKFHQ